MTNEEKEGLDPGIRILVDILNELGFRTIDSGDGVTKVAAGDEDALLEPHVFMRVESVTDLVSEANRLYDACSTLGIDLKKVSIEASYNPGDGVSIIALMGAGDASVSPTRLADLVDDRRLEKILSEAKSCAYAPVHERSASIWADVCELVIRVKAGRRVADAVELELSFRDAQCFQKTWASFGRMTERELAELRRSLGGTN